MYRLPTSSPVNPYLYKSVRESDRNRPARTSTTAELDAALSPQPSQEPVSIDQQMLPTIIKYVLQKGDSFVPDSVCDGAELPLTERVLPHLDAEQQADILESLVSAVFGVCLSDQDWERVDLNEYAPIDAALLLWARTRAKTHWTTDEITQALAADIQRVDAHVTQFSPEAMLQEKWASSRVRCLYDALFRHPDCALHIYLMVRSSIDSTEYPETPPSRVVSFTSLWRNYSFRDIGTSVEITPDSK